MKSVFKPVSSISSLVLAGLLATTSMGAMAQGMPAATAAGTPGMSAGMNAGRMGREDPAKMQAWMAKRQADMKVKLKITPAQEGAWTTFTTAMQPMARNARPAPEQRAELDKLTTPERIDKMRTLRTQRMADMSAAMDKRGEATKTFYAVLTPEQQKTFDAEHKKMGQHEGRGRHQGGMPYKG